MNETAVNETATLAGRYAGKRVLVTGGAGFIGSHLCDALAGQGASVSVIDNLQAGKWSNLSGASGVETIEADVRDASRMDDLLDVLRPAAVFHLAANASVPGSVSEPRYDFEANALGTFRVLDAIRRSKVECDTVVASSGAVYGEPKSFPIDENDALLPISPYGTSKLCTEEIGRMFASVYKQRVCLARIFNAYGPRMARFVILDFLKKLQNNPDRLEILGSGQQVRDFTYVGDTVQGLLTLAVHGSSGESYNISSGSACSVRELARMLIAARGWSDRTELSYTGQSWVGDAQRWEVSVAKIAQLGYVSNWPMDAGLDETIRWFDETQGNADVSGSDRRA